MARIESCPDLCARQGITRRHEVGPRAVAARAARVIWVLIAGMSGLLLRQALDRVLRTRFAERYVPNLYRHVLTACDIEVELIGSTAYADRGTPVLVVGNHVSWLDVMGLTSVQRVRMVSKREIGEWPVIGRVARAARTIFIDRHSPRAVERTRRDVAAALRAGEVVATFPEATTTCGRGLGRMYPAMFQAAIDAGVPVQPVALSFVDRHGALTTAAAYVGDQPLLESIRTILSQRGLRLRIEILPQISAKHVRPIDSRKALMTAAHRAISAALNPVVGDYEAHRRPVTCQAGPVSVPIVVDPLTALDAIVAGRKPAAA